MGREIRRVPPHWNQPQVRTSWGDTRDVSMHPESLAEAQAEWDTNWAIWQTGKEPYYVVEIPKTEAELAQAEADGDAEKAERQRTYLSYIQGKMDIKDASEQAFIDDYGERPEEPEPGALVIYRPWAPEEATWYQVWQTVSEGSPTTPPFATQAELVEYLVKYGQLYQGEDHGLNGGPLSRKAAEQFVYGAGWFPSMIIKNGVTYDVSDGFPD